MRVLQHGLVIWPPEWNIWTYFLRQTTGGLNLDALEQSHPIEVLMLSATEKDQPIAFWRIVCEACKQPSSSLLLLMDAYRKEEDNMELPKIINVCNNVINISTVAIPDLVNELKEFFLSLLLCSADTWRESFRCDVKGRSVYSFGPLATFNHHKTHREAMQRFQVLLDDKKHSTSVC
ncbi:hypothetical protein Ddye_012789 [Dipteronia dyeriana]|uniref:Uncharacterized protein n=1 Tax=Dipteronia dyeriana TaxID=168575 RepID=A0AAE0CJK9_9ROSI|nr:hypothetical protein Ddye_012789 [Dipteronia dyeriana]